MKIIVILFLCLLLTGCNRSNDSNVSYVPFQRVDYDHIKEKFVVDKDFSEDYLKNIILVLLDFRERFQFRNGELYITQELWEDKNELWNICNRAASDEKVKGTWNYERRKMIADFLLTDFNMQIDVKIDPVKNRAAYNRYMREVERYSKSINR